MAAFDPATLDRWRALAIVDRDGTTVGTISEFYLDRETGHPTWALVETGLFGATQTFVPLVHATEIEDGLQVPYEKRHIKDSPRVDPHDELTPDEEAQLFAHYGVDYEPAMEPLTTESAEAAPAAVTPEGPGPVPVGAGTDQEAEPVPEEPGTTEDPDLAPAAPGTTEGPGPVPEEPGTTEDPETAAGSSAMADAQGTDPADAQGAGPAHAQGAGPDEPGSAEPRASGRLGSETPASGPLGSDDQPGTVSGEPGITEGPGRVPPEAGTGGPDDATLIAQGEFGPAEHSENLPDPDLSRTAPVEPGLPGSTVASPGPVPATVDTDTTDPDGRTADDSLRDPDEPRWPPASAGSFDEHPADRPAGAGTSDHWREAKLAAERERLAREAAQPEERSPLERARRRLERLVGVGQDQPDDDATAPDREAAERARRARLGFDDDDPRFR